MEGDTTKPRPKSGKEECRLAGEASGPSTTRPPADSQTVAALAPPGAVDALYDGLKKSLVLEELKASNVVGSITHVMTFVEKQKGLTGSEKKEAVVRLIERLVGEIPGDGEDKLALQSAVQIFLSPTIDIIVAAVRGQLDLNKDGVVTPDEIVQASANCWRACFPCCGK